MLKADFVFGESEEQSETFEIDPNEIKFDLGNLEFERRQFRNIREKAAVVLELVDSKTEIDYLYPARPKFEVHGGYKIATQKGAKLGEVKVYNLYFRFKNHRLNAMTTAAMYRPPHKNEEWILLLPDDTAVRIENERREYINKATHYTFAQTMDSDYHDNLLENLKLLTPNERCAQSLMHEYGHVLHWRMFDY